MPFLYGCLLRDVVVVIKIGADFTVHASRLSLYHCFPFQIRNSGTIKRGKCHMHSTPMVYIGHNRGLLPIITTPW